MKVFNFLGKGVGHEDKGENCQDRLSIMTTEDGRTVCVVSDGCSSSDFAMETAQRNVDVINKIFSRFAIEELSRDSFAELYPMLEDYLQKCAQDDISACFQIVFNYELAMLARELNVAEPSSSDFCATLLFVICETNQTMIGHIGDGNIILYNKSGEVVYQSVADNGEDSRHTFFTINDNFRNHFRYDIIPTKSYQSLILFSDGPQTMFKLESGTVEKGAFELAIKKIASDQIKTNQEFASALQKLLANAMHYGFDDWSIIAAIKQLETGPEITPVSLKQMFFEVYNKEMVDSEKSYDEFAGDLPIDDSGVEITREEDSLQIPDIHHRHLSNVNDVISEQTCKTKHHKQIVSINKKKRCHYERKRRKNQG